MLLQVLLSIDSLVTFIVSASSLICQRKSYSGMFTSNESVRQQLHPFRTPKCPNPWSDMVIALVSWTKHIDICHKVKLSVVGYINIEYSTLIFSLCLFLVCPPNLILEYRHVPSMKPLCCCLPHMLCWLIWLLTMSSLKSACALLCIGIWFTLRIFLYFFQASKNLLGSNPLLVILVFWFSLKPYTSP